MSQIEIDLTEITTVNYNGNPLTELAFDTQTVWTIPTVPAGGEYVRNPQISTTGGTATFDPTTIGYDDKTGFGDGSGDTGTINEMSQDGTIVAYNFRDRIIILSRPDTSTPTWTLRDTITTYGELESIRKSFAMNHDGSYIVTGVGEGRAVVLTVFRWNGNSYDSVQSMQPYPSVLSYSGVYIEQVLFCQTVNAFAAIPSESEEAKVYGEFSGTFYEIGTPFVADGVGHSISDGGIGNTSTTYENINIAWSTGPYTSRVENQYGFSIVTKYSDRTVVYKLQNNEWVQKGFKLGPRISVNGVDVGNPSMYSTDVKQTILSQDGNSFIQSSKVKYTSSSSFEPEYKRFQFNNETQQYEVDSAIQFFPPLSALDRYRDTTGLSITASNDLNQVYAILSKFIPTDNPLPEGYYQMYFTGSTRGTPSIGNPRYNPMPYYITWTYRRHNYSLDGYTQNNATPFLNVHGGVSCDATGDISSYNNVVSKAVDGNSYSVSILYNTPTYRFTSSRDSIFENGSVIITLDTVGLPNTNVAYTITGIQAADIQEPLTGNFGVVDSTATVTINSVADSQLEGNQTLTLSLDNGQASIDVDILDTSV